MNYAASLLYGGGWGWTPKGGTMSLDKFSDEELAKEMDERRECRLNAQLRDRLDLNARLGELLQNKQVLSFVRTVMPHSRTTCVDDGYVNTRRCDRCDLEYILEFNFNLPEHKVLRLSFVDAPLGRYSPDPF